MRKKLQHPCHNHVLILQTLSRTCKLRCELCGQDTSGPIYRCEHCDFILHKWCSELPHQITHPSHRQHQLTLVTDFKYRCSAPECRLFEMDPVSAVSTLSPEDQHEKNELVESFPYHDHPLTSFRVTNTIKTECSICEDRISGSVYGCRECMFLIHESCARLPREIHDHPFHSQHALTLVVSDVVKFKCRCCNYSWKSAYCCWGCDFYLDFGCAISALSLPEQRKSEAVKLENFPHPHPLVSVYMKERYSYISCKFCMLPIGSGDIYSCLELDCSFMLHKSCAEIPSEMLHPLTLYPESQYRSGRANCRVCGCSFSGYVFNCKMCGFDLDPRCALQTHSACEDGASPKIRHFAHDGHPLTLSYILSNRGLKCSACVQPVSGVVYCCREEPACHGIVLHRSCAELPLTLEHPFHPPHQLVLLSESSRGEFYCAACHKRSEGYTYCCTDCGFHLDIECAQDRPTLKGTCHQHDLTYFEKTSYLQCNCCGYSCNDDLYRCVLCNFNVHHDCLPLPPVITHECHHHPLAFRDKVTSDGNEQCCDLCGNTRNPEHGVYYCEQCQYVAEIECVISEVKPEKGRLIARLDEEIARVMEKIGAMETSLQGLKINLKELETMRDQ